VAGYRQVDIPSNVFPLVFILNNRTRTSHDIDIDAHEKNSSQNQKLSFSELKSCHFQFRRDVNQDNDTRLQVTNFAGQLTSAMSSTSTSSKKSTNQLQASTVTVLQHPSVHVWVMSANDKPYTQNQKSLSASGTVHSNSSSTTNSISHPRAHTDIFADHLWRQKKCDVSNEAGRTLFLEEKTEQGVQIISKVIKGILDPIIEQVSSLAFQGPPEQISETVGHTMLGPMKEEVIKGVSANVVAQVPPAIEDAIVEGMTERLATEIANAVSPPVSDKVSKAINPQMKDTLMNVLEQTLPVRLEESLPYSISKLMVVDLIDKLTKSVTHSLVPSLTRAVSTTYQFSYFCFLCTKYKMHCMDCEHLQISQYQVQYYGVYFSSYYATYYGDYYKDAMRQVTEDDKLWPAPFSPEAQLVVTNNRKGQPPPSPAIVEPAGDSGAEQAESLLEMQREQYEKDKLVSERFLQSENQFRRHAQEWRSNHPQVHTHVHLQKH
jgi:hypothetical protein